MYQVKPDTAASIAKVQHTSSIRNFETDIVRIMPITLLVYLLALIYFHPDKYCTETRHGRCPAGLQTTHSLQRQQCR